MKAILTALSVLLALGGGNALAQTDETAQDQTAQPGQDEPATGPVSVQELRDDASERSPAAAKPQPAKPQPAGQSRATETSEAVQSTQNAFLEVSPGIGAISIADKAAFSVGTNLSFNVIQTMPLYFEPSVFISFYPGQDANNPTRDKNAALFHIDAGLRYDWIISGSPLIPFVRAAVGPTIASTADVQSSETGDTISDSYLNQFYGGGLRLLINPNVMARADAGLTFQGTNPGMYFLGSAVLPL